MKSVGIVIAGCAALFVSACAVEPQGVEQQEVTGTEASALGVGRTLPGPVVRTTLDIWNDRCGTGSAPVGVIVPRDTWSCPDVAAGPGQFVGMLGSQWIAEGAAMGIGVDALSAWNPDLTQAMTAGQQPFCVYTYEVAPPVSATTPASIRFAAQRVSALESVVGPIAGPLCVPSTPAPGSTGCPSCWGAINYGAVYVIRYY